MPGPSFVVMHVAEKPSVAREIAGCLGKGAASKRSGLSQYNPIYEFTGLGGAGSRPQWLNGSSSTSIKHIVCSVAGHVMQVDFPSNYRSWKSCNPKDLFTAPIEKHVPESKRKIADTLTREARKSNVLLLWLDCDREGENICYEVIQLCRAGNRQMDVWRAVFSDLTPRSINNAFMSPRRPLEGVSAAVDARQEMDLRIGAVFTRFQTLRAQGRFPALANMVLSFGPCQFPTLGFVVDRYWQIESFVPETFWSIDCKVRRVGFDALVDFVWARGRLFDRFCTLVLYEGLCSHPSATVRSVDGRPVRKWRPFPLTTVELQKLGARKLKIGSEQVMKIAEEIYQKGFISYPRTETDQFPDNMDYPQLIGEQAGDHSAAWSAYAQSLLQPNTGLLGDKFHVPKRGRNNDQSHPPIHPTKAAHTALSGNAQRVYELIARHFLACCSDDAHGAETKVLIEIDEEEFTARGLMIHQRNFLDVYPYQKWSSQSLPEFRVGDTFDPERIIMTESQTRPPNLLTEADLISLMDKNGIGTDATIAQHIETIQTREYVEKIQADGNQSAFTPTTLGCALVDAYNSMGFPELSLPQLRAETEHWIKRVAENAIAKDAALRDAVRKYEGIFARVQQASAKLDGAMAKYFGPNAAQHNGYPQQSPQHNQPPAHQPDRPPDRRPPQRQRSEQIVGFRNSVDHDLMGIEEQAPAAHGLDHSNAVIPNCDCGAACLSRTTQQGTNQGRRFWRCAKGREAQCDFFQWMEDAPRPAAVAGDDRMHVLAPDRGADLLIGNEPAPVCEHNKPACQRTVRKEGANQGKQFWSCSEPQNASCGFFQWVERDPVQAAASCFECGLAGHFADKCPQRARSGPETQQQRPAAVARPAVIGSNVQCFSCGGSGHYARDCNVASGHKRPPAASGAFNHSNESELKKRKPPKCGLCGQLGHNRRACKGV